jgi:hypothetical protein
MLHGVQDRAPSKQKGRIMKYSRGRVVAWLAAACTALTGGVGSAATLKVCLDTCSHKTVQSAVDAAANNDQIIVYPGRYVGNITIVGKSLGIISSTRNPNEVTLIGAGTGPVFTLGANNGGQYYDEFLYYITITGGSHFGGTGEGGGVQVRQGATLILLNSNVIGNTAAAGGGVSMNTPGGPTNSIQQSCLVSSNTAYIGGGIYVAPNSSLNLSDQCVVSNNTASGNPSTNSGGLGGGVYAAATSQLTLAEPIITNNSATAQLGCQTTRRCPAAGGGIYALGQVQSFGADLMQNNVYNPWGTAQGGGMYVVVSPTQVLGGLTIDRNYVYSGSLPASGGGLYAASTDPKVSWTLDTSFVLFNNATANDPSAPPAAGGIQNVGKLTFTGGTTLTGNFPSQCLGGESCPTN